ncbi:MAG: hypothetical protein MK132_02610 [Lentisphaerales bacterium]|nr:hypothetical protein [Lentisphaerales bacterium]
MKVFVFVGVVFFGFMFSQNYFGGNTSSQKKAAAEYVKMVKIGVTQLKSNPMLTAAFTDITVSEYKNKNGVTYRYYFKPGVPYQTDPRKAKKASIAASKGVLTDEERTLLKKVRGDFEHRYIFYDPNNQQVLEYKVTAKEMI